MDLSYLSRARYILQEVPEGENDDITNLAAVCDALANAIGEVASNVQALARSVRSLEERTRRLESK